MKPYNKALIAILAAASLASCSDFLDKQPLSAATEAIMFQTPDQFEAAANALYGLPGWKTKAYDGGTDISGIGSNGGTSVQEGHGAWGFGGLRNCNILLEKAQNYSDQEAIKTSIGTAYFFRAWLHFEMLKQFGGVPIIDHVVDISDPVVYGPRNSRYEVAAIVKEDLLKAIDMLPKRSTKSGVANRGLLTREAAQAFLARVALFEGSWEKYTANIGLDLDGDGVSVGAGKFKPEGYPSVEQWYQLAKDMSAEVIREAESGTFELWNECEELSYYYLFSIDDSNGCISNFMGAGKATNHEFILCTPYDYTLRRSGTNNCHSAATSQLANISAYLGESFLCSNGLPIYYSETGDLKDAHYNPEFGGYDTYMGEFDNRDWRFLGCAYLPDRNSFYANSEYGESRTEAGPKYASVIYPEATDHFDGTEACHSSKQVKYNPYIDKNATFNSYGCRKYLPENATRTDNNDAADFPVIRLAEVHCIYAEATCELGNGQISDSDLNFSINKNRARARVAPLTNALIANIYDCNWFNFATGRHEMHKLTMLDEIRRERMCELFGEGFRLDDLKRWGIAHINMTGQKLGRKILGTYYGNPNNKVNSSTYSGEPVYNPETRPLQYGMVSENPEDLDYGRPIATVPGNCLWALKDYLDYVPAEQIRLNPALLQNPGW